MCPMVSIYHVRVNPFTSGSNVGDRQPNVELEPKFVCNPLFAPSQLIGVRRNS
jgi:hypothetical protein